MHIHYKYFQNNFLACLYFYTGKARSFLAARAPAKPDLLLHVCLSRCLVEPLVALDLHVVVKFMYNAHVFGHQLRKCVSLNENVWVKCRDGVGAEMESPKLY